MQIKIKIFIVIICFLNCFTLNLKLYADEFNISAEEIFIDKENEIVIGKGLVEAIDSEGKIINANKKKVKIYKIFLRVFILQYI